MTKEELFDIWKLQGNSINGIIAIYNQGIKDFAAKMLKEYPLMENDFGMVVNEQLRENVRKYEKELKL